MGKFTATIPLSSFMSNDEIEALKKTDKIFKEVLEGDDLLKWEDAYSRLVSNWMMRGKLKDFHRYLNKIHKSMKKNHGS
jgi:hypothetical protein